MLSYAIKKPMLNAELKKPLLSQEISTLGVAKWRKVMFSDESTYILVGEVPKMVRCPSTLLRYNPKLMVKTVKHPENEMCGELLLEI